MCARNNWAYWPQPVSLGTSAIKRPHSGKLVATNQLFCLLGAVASRYWPTWRHREAGHALRSVRPKAHRSEEHTSELQSRGHLVCRLLLEKKNNKHIKNHC